MNSNSLLLRYKELCEFVGTRSKFKWEIESLSTNALEEREARGARNSLMPMTTGAKQTCAQRSKLTHIRLFLALLRYQSGVPVLKSVTRPRLKVDERERESIVEFNDVSARKELNGLYKYRSSRKPY